MIKKLHFKVRASFFNKLVRDIYWFENRKRATNMIRCLNGITFKQESLFFTGNMIFKDCKNEELELKEYDDKKFKKDIIKFLFLNKKEIPVKNNCRSGWLLRNGEFLEIPQYGHSESAYMICEKLKEIKEFEYLPQQYERSLELYGAIKITGNNILFDDSLEISGEQVETIKNFFKNYEREKKKCDINKKEFNLIPLSYLNKDLQYYKDFKDKTDLFDYLKEDLLE